jgi:hypothetical protein
VGPIVIGYDGSEHARAAIERAGALLRPGPAVVVTVWSTLEAAAPVALLALPSGVVGEAIADIDEASRAAAEAIAAAARSGREPRASMPRRRPSAAPAARCSPR